MKEFGKRVTKYLSEVWGEVKPREGKVSWPSADEVKGSTAVVVVTVGILGAFLFVIDISFGRIIAMLLGVQ